MADEETNIRASQYADKTADENWSRYIYVRQRGHQDYMEDAARNDRFYLGGGGQWRTADRAKLESEGRACLEFNEIMPAVNAALGYQIQNRLDITFLPRGGKADMGLATLFGKVFKQVSDETHLKWVETQVLADGLIEQRGYFDVRVDFDDSFKGNINISDVDPRDVIPDPDAKSYDPKDWGDVIVTRWLTGDEIEQLYGSEARQRVEGTYSQDTEGDFGDTDGDEPRNKFGDNDTGSRDWDATLSQVGIKRWRIIDRQRWVYESTPVVIDPETGDVRIAANPTKEQMLDWKSKGLLMSRQVKKRVKWTVSTCYVTLMDDYSPYPFFTIVPYFPFFRRGKTRGIVDNGVGPQEALNKALSQFVHIINTTANSGWMVHENSLTNMDTDDLSTEGAKSGLVVEWKGEADKKPSKIEPNKVPQGIDRLIDRATQGVRSATVPDAIRGKTEQRDPSGILFQSMQTAAQTELAVPLDNLGRTRHMLAERVRDLIQIFYDDARVLRITEDDPKTGQKVTSEVQLNEFDQATGRFRNDLTVGTYDIVVSEVPLQATFENNQFAQALEIKKVAPTFPDSALVKHSNLTEKYEILQQMAQPQGPSPVDEAKIRQMDALTEKARTETVSKRVEAQFESIQTAAVIAQTPATAPLADQILASAGFEDQDAPPILPTIAAPVPGALPPVENTNPMTPAGPGSPAVGKQLGIEGGEDGQGVSP